MPETTVATAVLLLLHVPPVVGCDKVEDDPMQVFVVPVIAEGAPFTVAIVVTLQPPGAVYVMFTVPAVTPVNMPVDAPIVAIAVAPLVHVPPLVALLNVTVWPTHTSAVPVIDPGAAFTVTIVVRGQPPET